MAKSYSFVLFQIRSGKMVNALHVNDIRINEDKY